MTTFEPHFLRRFLLGHSVRGCGAYDRIGMEYIDGITSYRNLRTDGHGVYNGRERLYVNNSELYGDQYVTNEPEFVEHMEDMASTDDTWAKYSISDLDPLTLDDLYPDQLYEIALALPSVTGDGRKFTDTNGNVVFRLRRGQYCVAPTIRRYALRPQDLDVTADELRDRGYDLDALTGLRMTICCPDGLTDRHEEDLVNNLHVLWYHRKENTARYRRPR